MLSESLFITVWHLLNLLSEGEKQFACHPILIAPQQGETAVLLADTLFSARCCQHRSQSFCCRQQEATQRWPELVHEAVH